MQKMIRKMKVNKRDIFCGKNWSSSMALRMLSTQIKIINLFVLSDNKADSKLFDKTLRTQKQLAKLLDECAARADKNLSHLRALANHPLCARRGAQRLSLFFNPTPIFCLFTTKRKYPRQQQSELFLFAFVHDWYCLHGHYATAYAKLITLLLL